MLTFTDRARDMIRSFIEQSEGELQALRITAGGSPFAPRYELTLVGEEDRREDEVAVDSDGDFPVLVSEAQADRVHGATVDYVERVNESGFEVQAPAAENGAGAVEAPRGPIAEKVQEVLKQQVNPSIASHGGAIDLVDVQGTEIYLEMSGGCQGCAMSRMTLRQGVERMLRQAVPEITAVHDITDHASGENPFYAQQA